MEENRAKWKTEEWLKWASKNGISKKELVDAICAEWSKALKENDKIKSWRMTEAADEGYNAGYDRGYDVGYDRGYNAGVSEFDE